MKPCLKTATAREQKTPEEEGFFSFFLFFSMFDFGLGQGPQKNHVGGHRDVNIRDFVVVHARSMLQSPHSPWTSRRPRCVVHYRRGPHRDLVDRGHCGEVLAKTSWARFFTPKKVDLSVFQQGAGKSVNVQNRFARRHASDVCRICAFAWILGTSGTLPKTASCNGVAHTTVPTLGIAP
jgi:hypothetical protein